MGGDVFRIIKVAGIESLGGGELRGRDWMKTRHASILTGDKQFVKPK